MRTLPTGARLRGAATKFTTVEGNTVVRSVPWLLSKVEFGAPAVVEADDIWMSITA